MRAPTNRTVDRKIFNETATKVRSINYGTPMRGGIRL